MRMLSRVLLIAWLAIAGLAQAQINNPPLTAENVGRRLYDRSPLESAAGITQAQIRSRYEWGDARRYGAIPNDSIDDTAALQRWLNVCAEGQGITLPEGIYDAGDLTLAVTTKEGCRVQGFSTGDYGTSAGNAPSRGSILRYTGTGDFLTIDGGQEPKYMEFDGLTLIGNASADNGIVIKRATWIAIRRSGFFGFSQASPAASSIKLTIAPGTFTGGIRMESLWWSSGNIALNLADGPLNIIDCRNCDFHSMQYGVYQPGSVSSNYVRHLKMVGGDCEEVVKSCVLMAGGVAAFTFRDYYVEQNNASENDPRIDLNHAGTAPLSGAVDISNNIWSKQLGAASTRMIRIVRADGVKVQNNWSAYGDEADRYFLEFGTNVTNYEVEPAIVPSGSTAYPIRISSASYTSAIHDRLELPLIRAGGIEGYRDLALNLQSVSYNLALSDRGKQIKNGNNSGIVYTILNDATVPWTDGSWFWVVNDSTGTMTVAPGGSVTMVWAAGGGTGTRTLASRGVLFCLRVAGNRWLVWGFGVT